MLNVQTRMVQVADLLRSNGIRWSPQAKSSPAAVANTKPQGTAPGGDFALCTTSGEPLDHDKGRALDPRRMRCILP